MTLIMRKQMWNACCHTVRRFFFPTWKPLSGKSKPKFKAVVVKYLGDPYIFKCDRLFLYQKIRSTSQLRLLEAAPESHNHCNRGCSICKLLKFIRVIKMWMWMLFTIKSIKM